MSTPGRLIGFAPITDADRAKAFYTDVLGLEFVKDDGFALVFRSGENMVRLARVPEVQPVQSTILGWETVSVKDEVERLAGLGVAFLRYPFLEQDEHGIWNAPGGDTVAWFKDPDGNVLSLSQHV
jgi:catechol 2,3-dioxygenase-like lactoylglutathione lyase family enzyme